MKKIDSNNIATDYIINPKQHILQKSNTVVIDYSSQIKELAITQQVNANSNIALTNSSKDIVSKINDNLGKDLNNALKEKNIGLLFKEDKDTGQLIIQFIDSKTKEVVQQIPTEDSVKLMKNIQKFIQNYDNSIKPGIILNQTA